MVDQFVNIHFRVTKDVIHLGLVNVQCRKVTVGFGAMEQCDALRRLDLLGEAFEYRCVYLAVLAAEDYVLALLVEHVHGQVLCMFISALLSIQQQ